MDSVELFSSSYLIGLLFWIATIFLSVLYIWLQSRKKCLRIEWETENLVIKTGLVALSLSSILTVIRGSQPSGFSSGSAGFLVIFGLVIWFRDTVASLKNKLDELLVDNLRNVAPSPQDSTQEILLPLREFVTRWEQYKGLGEKRWVSGQYRLDLQSFAKSLSDELLKFHSKHMNLNEVLRNQMRILTDELSQFGLARLLVSYDFDAMEEHGEKAFQMTQALITLLETKQSTASDEK